MREKLFSKRRKRLFAAKIKIILYNFYKSLFFLDSVFLEGCRGSNSRLSRHTSRTINTDCISLGKIPRSFNIKARYNHKLLFSPTLFFKVRQERKYYISAKKKIIKLLIKPKIYFFYMILLICPGSDTLSGFHKILGL